MHESKLTDRQPYWLLCIILANEYGSLYPRDAWKLGESMFSTPVLDGLVVGLKGEDCTGVYGVRATKQGLGKTGWLWYGW